MNILHTVYLYVCNYVCSASNTVHKELHWYCNTCTFYIHTCACTVTVLQTDTVQTTIFIQYIHVQLYSTTYCTCILYSDTVDMHTVLHKCTHEYSTTSAAAHHTQYGILPGGCLPHGGDAGLLLVTHWSEVVALWCVCSADLFTT